MAKRKKRGPDVQPLFEAYSRVIDAMLTMMATSKKGCNPQQKRWLECFSKTMRTAARERNLDLAKEVTIDLVQKVKEWCAAAIVTRENLRYDRKQISDQERVAKTKARADEARDRVAGLMNGKGLGKTAACKKVADEEGVALRTVQRWCKKT